MIKQLALLAVLSLEGTSVMAQDRMPEIPADRMTEAQKKAASEFAEGRGYAVRGPFAAMLRSPEVMLRAKAMGDYVRFKSTIPARLNELAIIITARQWSQNYEWQAHRPLAEKAGLRSEIAQAIADGRRPTGMSADEEIVYDFSMELYANKSVSDATYQRAVEKFGEQGIIDLTAANAYYSFNAMMLNVARTALPAGAKAELQPFPK
ncbi:MAG TPA: carboxymuconolactone decarboxylase family protein [Hyphomicrobiaceae bacterium]|nr:carboxymuconolactone decarboxylase family protein [Hyphomicrobiaceae bacterium]